LLLRTVRPTLLTKPLDSDWFNQTVLGRSLF
jgi:hypothetical protein